MFGLGQYFENWDKKPVVFDCPEDYKVDRPVLVPRRNRLAADRRWSFPVGMGPYPTLIANPTVRDCVQHFGTYEYTIMAMTTLIPAYLSSKKAGRSTLAILFHRSFVGGVKSPWCIAGLITGFSAGCLFAYQHAHGMPWYSLFHFYSSSPHRRHAL